MRIAFDPELRRPACPILQAAHGCDPHMAHPFPCEAWLVAPTPGMAVFDATDEQLESLVAMARAST